METARIYVQPEDPGSGGTIDLEFKIEGQRYRAVYVYGYEEEGL